MIRESPLSSHNDSLPDGTVSLRGKAGVLVGGNLTISGIIHGSVVFPLGKKPHVMMYIIGSLNPGAKYKHLTDAAKDNYLIYDGLAINDNNA